MQPAVLALILAALHLHVPVHPSAEAREPEQTHHNQRRRSGRVKHPAAMRHVPLNLNPDGTRSDNTVGSPGRAERRRLPCKGINRQPFNPGETNTAACLFRNAWLELASENGAYRVPPEEPGPGTRGRLNRLPRPLASRRRRRRSDPVNPSDPLRSESHPGNPAAEEQDPPGPPEQDQAVSKETITSCDDPLKVLHSDRPVSPIKTNAEQE